MATNAAVANEMAKPPPPYSGPAQPTPATPAAQPKPAPATLVTPLKQLRDMPQNIDCPFCQRQTRTRVVESSSSTTMMATVACCLCTGLLCVWVPSVMKWCADVDHYCVGCNAHVVHIPYDGVPDVKDPAAPRMVVSKHAPQMQPQMKAQPQVEPQVQPQPQVEPQPQVQPQVQTTPEVERGLVEAAPAREGVVAPVGASEAAVVVDSEKGRVEGSGAAIAPTQENDPVVIHNIK